MIIHVDFKRRNVKECNRTTRNYDPDANKAQSESSGQPKGSRVMEPVALWCVVEDKSHGH